MFPVLKTKTRKPSQSKRVNSGNNGLEVIREQEDGFYKMLSTNFDAEKKDSINSSKPFGLISMNNFDREKLANITTSSHRFLRFWGFVKLLEWC